MNLLTNSQYLICELYLDKIPTNNMIKLKECQFHILADETDIPCRNLHICNIDIQIID